MRTAPRVDRLLLAILGFTLARGIAWAALLPPLQAPDELVHFAYVQYLAEQHEVPVARPGELGLSRELDDFAQRTRFEEIRFRPNVGFRPTAEDRSALAGRPYGAAERKATGNSSAAGYPPGHYALAALPTLPFGPEPLVVRFYAARLASVLLGLVPVWAAWRVARSLVPGSRTLPGAAAFAVALHPMFAMMSGAVNNDALLNAAAALVVAWGVSAVERPPRPGLAAAGGAAAALALLAKPQGLFLAAAAGGALAAVLAAALRRGEIGAPEAGRRLAAFAVGLLVPWIPWAAFSLARYGSPFGVMGLQPSVPGGGNLKAWIVSSLLSKAAVQKAKTLWIQTFWAEFGWLDTRFPSGALYSALAILTVAALAGALVALLRPRAGAEAPARPVLGALLLFALANLAFLYAVEGAYFRRYGTLMLQGRYLFTAIVPILVLLFAGTRRLLPSRWAPGVDLALAGGLALLHGASVLLLLDRYFGVRVG